MFIFSLFSLTNSIYVSANISEVSHPDVYTEKDISLFVKNNLKTIILLIDEYSESSSSYAQCFADASTVFGQDAYFVTLTSETGPHYFETYYNNGKNLIFIDGSRSTYTSFPRSEAEFSFLLETFIYGDLPPLSDIDQLNGLLRSCAYTILSTPDQRPIAEDLFYRFLPTVGPIIILNVSPSLLRAAGCSGNKLAIYRRIDKVVEEFDYDPRTIKTKGMDAFESFQKVLHPLFIPQMTSNLIENTDSLLGVFITTQIRSQERDMLERLGTDYPEITFGATSPRHSITTQYLIGQRLSAPSFAVLNYKRFYFYGGISNATEETIREFLDGIRSGKIKGNYPSEPVEAPLALDINSSITKVVGSTYERFINDATNDVIMFYLNDFTKNSLNFVREFGYYIKQKRVKGLKIGYINASSNSAKIGFPDFFIEPSIQLFPANDKLGNRSFYGGRTAYSIIDFLKKYGTVAIKKDEETFDADAELYYMNFLLREVRNYNKEVQTEIMQYVTDMGMKLRLGRTTEEVIKGLRKVNIQRKMEREAELDAELEEEQVFNEDEQGQQVEEQKTQKAVLPPRKRKAFGKALG